MEIATVLLWVQIVTEVGAVLERLMEVGRRIEAGENVTREELLTAKRETAEAVARWDAASENDRR